MSRHTDDATGAEALAAAAAATGVARDALARTRAHRDELLVLAAHDIRNAAGIVDSALTMLEDGPDLAASMHGMMRRAAHRLGILTRALVDVDLLERDAMPLSATTVRWAAVVHPVVEAALPAGATKDLTLQPGGDLAGEVVCDPTLVERTLAALVEHAIGAAPNGSTVDVAGERIGPERFRLWVAHAGRPVGDALLEKYFTTLPLRFARLAAIRHGGVLRAVSPLAAGTGFAFEVELTA